MRRPLLLGHRGARAHREVAENSLASFELAMRQGCDGFEFDVRRTADGVGVICHDPVWRAGSGLSGRLRGVEIAGARREELEELAELDEVIERYKTTAFLDVELKTAGLAEGLVRALRATKARSEFGADPTRGEQPGSGKAAGFVVSSFLPEILEEVKRVDGSLALGLICETREQLDQWRELPVEYVIPHHRILTAELLETLHVAGKRVMVWTVNREEEMRKFAGWGVEGIISDETELLVKTLRET